MDEQTIQIMSFNLRRDPFYTKRFVWGNRRDGVIEIIRQSDADIIGVQEMTPEMKKDLETKLDEFSIFGTGRSRKLLGEYSGILVRNETVEVLSNHTFWLSKNPDKQGSHALLAPFPRICTTIEVYLKRSKQRMRVFNTHFDHISWFARKLSAQTILKYIRDYNSKDPLPVILTGDFNAKPYSKAIKMLITSNEYVSLNNIFTAFDISDTYINTYHGFSDRLSKYPIDYIFFSNDFVVNDFQILKNKPNGEYPSDHFPILARLQIQPQGAH